jgi:hypothetical protein
VCRPGGRAVQLTTAARTQARLLRVLYGRTAEADARGRGPGPLVLVPTSKVVFLARRYSLVVTLVATPAWLVPDGARPGQLVADTAWATSVRTAARRGAGAPMHALTHPVRGEACVCSYGGRLVKLLVGLAQPFVVAGLGPGELYEVGGGGRGGRCTGTTCTHGRWCMRMQLRPEVYVTVLAHVCCGTTTGGGGHTCVLGHQLRLAAAELPLVLARLEAGFRACQADLVRCVGVTPYPQPSCWWLTRIAIGWRKSRDGLRPPRPRSKRAAGPGRHRAWRQSPCASRPSWWPCSTRELRFGCFLRTPCDVRSRSPPSSTPWRPCR